MDVRTSQAQAGLSANRADRFIFAAKCDEPVSKFLRPGLMMNCHLTSMTWTQVSAILRYLRSSLRWNVRCCLNAVCIALMDI